MKAANSTKFRLQEVAENFWACENVKSIFEIMMVSMFSMFNADDVERESMFPSYFHARIRKSDETIKHINTRALRREKESSLLWW